jgi:glycosyltransferase involved in cell wall biosynthesis
VSVTAARSAPSEPVANESGSPRASVVMTVYKDLRFLDAAVDSVLQQDFRDLELVIVDDGNDQHAIFQALERRDPRIRLVVNPTNLGTAAAANRGIAAARAGIIVRLDADDVAEPTRVGRLVAALAGDPQLGLVGSWCSIIDGAGQTHGLERTPETDLEIRWTILFHNPFYHSTVAFRRSCFEAAGGYRAEELVSHDHYLWFAMLPFCRAQNIAEPLARYRWNPQGLVATNSKNPRNRTHLIRETLWARLGLVYDLYDDAFALDLSNFVKGIDITVAGRRAAAYRVILTLLGAFLAAPRPFARPEDAKTARRLARNIVWRVLTKPPHDPREMLKIVGLCWPLARHAATAQ